MQYGGKVCLVSSLPCPMHVHCKLCTAVSRFSDLNSAFLAFVCGRRGSLEHLRRYVGEKSQGHSRFLCIKYDSNMLLFEIQNFFFTESPRFHS